MTIEEIDFTAARATAKFYAGLMRTNVKTETDGNLGMAYLVLLRELGEIKNKLHEYRDIIQELHKIFDSTGVVSNEGDTGI